MPTATCMAVWLEWHIRERTKTGTDKCGFFSSLCGSADLIGPILIRPTKCGTLGRSA